MFSQEPLAHLEQRPGCNVVMKCLIPLFGCRDLDKGQRVDQGAGGGPGECGRQAGDGAQAGGELGGRSQGHRWSHSGSILQHMEGIC